MNASDEAAADLIARLVPAVLRALHALEFTSRHISPDTLPELIRTIRARPDDLPAALDASKASMWPEQLVPVRDCLERAGETARASLAAFTVSLEAEQPMLAVFRSLRGYAKAAEAIYPLAALLKPVSQYFLEEARRDDAVLAAKLAAADPTREGVGFMHVDGRAGTRGAFSLYVPEYYDASRAWPLVVAMHGGSGNGGAFLWSWVREARSRGVVVLAPTAQGSTWSLMEPEVDGPNIASMVERVSADWNIDAGKQLLTGMSDGGTFTYVLGLRGDCRFTHLAPIAAAFHPLLMNFADRARVRGLPVQIVHGKQDWMFPPELAVHARRALEQAGAAVELRVIDDLSHTYPRDQNGPLLDWFLQS